MDDNNRDEKMGRAIVEISWLFLALKFIVIITVIALGVLYFLKKPLWLAPLIAIGLFILYRLCLKLVGKFVEWSGKQ